MTVEDWENHRFRLEHEPIKRKRWKDVIQKDRELAELLFAMLEASRDERALGFVAIPTAFARMADPRGYPGHHWSQVIAEDEHMRYDGFAIHYSDFRAPLERVLHSDDLSAEESFSPAEGRQIYRFKASLSQRSSLWRRIEIEGRQTLGEFDAVLRDAFEHDPFDHLSGFWKRVRRGKGARFRKVDLGSIEPFEGGDAADLCIAGLGLRPGDELEYVYDFGDWIEHRIRLEKIVEPQSEGEYPRIVAQNEPQYQDCERCQAQGRQSRAMWVCIECSNREERDVLLCEECLLEEHEDHHAEEILY